MTNILYKIVLAALVCCNQVTCDGRGQHGSHDVINKIEVLGRQMEQVLHGMDRLDNEMEGLNEKFAVFKNETRVLKHDKLQASTMVFRAFQCSENDVTLSCPEDQTISVVGAEYGVYGYESSQRDLTCKPPKYDADCRESWDGNFHSAWLDLKENCDGQNSCMFTPNTEALKTCAGSPSAAYSDIMYQCHSETYDWQTVAFSARASGSRSYTCSVPEIGVFDVVTTDTTNSYNPITNTFTCPLSGVYMFTVSLVNIDLEYGFGTIMHGTTRRASIDCYDGYVADSDRNQASNTVMFQCEAGESVWVEIKCGSYLYGEIGTIFSGMLIY